VTKGEAKAYCKYTGDKNVRLHTTSMSPLDSQKLLASATDEAIPDRGLRFMVILWCAGQQKPLELTHRQVGQIMHRSERQAQRIVEELERLGKIRIQRNGRQANLYSLASAVYGVESLLPCGRCGRRRAKLFGMEQFCDGCRRKRNLKAKLAAFRKANPGQPLAMQNSGARMSRVFLEVAQELDDEEKAG
jgi:hypothetical protein